MPIEFRKQGFYFSPSDGGGVGGKGGRTALMEAVEQTDSAFVQREIRRNWQAVLKRDTTPSLTLATINERSVGSWLDSLPNDRMVILFEEGATPFSEPLVRVLRIIREADSIRRESRRNAPYPASKHTLVADLEDDLMHLKLRYQIDPQTDAAQLYQDSAAFLKEHYA